MEEYECIDELGQTVAIGRNRDELMKSLEWYLEETNRSVEGIDCYAPDGRPVKIPKKLYWYGREGEEW